MDKLVSRLLLLAACSSAAILALIALFIFKEGVPIMARSGLGAFLLGRDWSPLQGQFGILPFIIGSLCITLGALLIGVPLGVACAVYLAEFSSPRWVNILKPAIELLAGIPSVVYGFLGVMWLAPLIRIRLGGPGLSILAASCVLAIMTLPTIVSISIDALQAVPKSYKQGSLALGATEWQTVWRVLFPAARAGILAGVILGMGRAIGETMAVIMISGNSTAIPHSALDSVRTLTANIAIEMGYATGEHRQALFATGVILFFFIMILNGAALRFARRKF
ncbi:MAG: phosphate ABC transporter permease subunit PstC [Deltaproteobacteria bacterium RIFOXYA12_FULL_58_15]|nr:MAG: phosphate ABC transporter permease subunit PstC [Deltaproteobacteria bacterium RIFOXYA12_FULL_58_15]OGR09024.1 MAG: phosphate ABC transporter permease subunit PstC [Deltaproteobacteria bacterium RIFOXYB12_FULL_58_9]